MSLSSIAENQRKADAFLARYRGEPLGHHIDGRRHLPEHSSLFDNLSPTDHSALCQVAEGGEAEIDAACLAAERAFPAWRALSGNDRKALLFNLADKIVAKAEEIALIESLDTGQPLRFMRAAAVRGAENFRFFAARALEAEDGAALYQVAHSNFTRRQPIGPVGVITPWNTPFMLSTWKIAPALAAGCTVVHKPAEHTPLSAMILAELSVEAGFPPGVWNTVNGFGETAGRRLSEHPSIKAVAFVGESATGANIMAQGAPTLKRVHFELGGKNPILVFDDADFERALDAAVFMIYSLNGERCTSSSRLLVQNGIRERFIAALSKRVANIRVGHPLNLETEVGPLVHREHFEKVMSYVEAAKAERACVAVGGRRCKPPFSDGNYFEPTLFTEARNDMKIAREEIFGPVLTAIGFDSEEEAVALANDTPYGLCAYVWTRDGGRAMRVANAIDAGMLWINSENNRNLPSPFGGMKMSGIGRDGGDYSFDFYMETKNICFAHDTHKVPILGRAVQG